MNSEGTKKEAPVREDETSGGRERDSGIEQCTAAEFFGYSAPAQPDSEQSLREQDILQAFSRLNDSSRLREQFLDCIRNLMIRQRGSNRYPDRNSILTILNMMQNNRDLLMGREEDRGMLGPEELARPLQDFTRILVASSVGSINQVQLDTIEGVRRTFNKLLSDTRLGARCRVMVSDLQIPYLKINFMDRGFLTKAEHPATQVLKRLLIAGAKWSRRTSFDNDPLYKECVRIHGRIVDEFENRLEVFDDIMRTSRLFGDGTAAGSKSSDHNRLDMDDGSPVARLVTIKLAGRQLSPDVDRFIRGPWSAVMTRIQDQYGERHRLWAQAISVIDRLVWLTQPKTGPRQKEDLQARFPGLLLDIEEGMKLISYSRPYKEGLVAKLMQIYADHLQR